MQANYPGSGRITEYLTHAGSRSWMKRRRTLDRTTARRMVAVREARRAFRRFHASCFWSYRPDFVVGEEDIAWVAEQLMKHGNREAWMVAKSLLDKSHV